MKKLRREPLEKEVTELWQRLVRQKVGLVAEDGSLIEVIYPGRPGSGGPDFRDAAIATAAGVRRGDIELHVRATGWEVHKHHLDRAYRDVVLHVALWNDTGAAFSRHSGREIPLIALGRLVGEDLFAESGLPDCPAARRPPGRLGAALDVAGERRFRAKAAALKAEMELSSPEEVLYRGIMGALGYSRNQDPFRAVACLLPFSRLQAVARAAQDSRAARAAIESALLGTAGFTGPRPEGYRSNRAETLRAGSWRLGGLRPANYPARRLSGMSRLAYRYRAGLLTALLRTVRDAALPGEIMAAVGVGPEIPGKAPLIGLARASEIVVNIILPFALAWGEASSDPILAARALDFFGKLKTVAPNSVVRHMRTQLGLAGAPSARREQGMLHIYKEYCREGNCRNCPLDELEIGDDIEVERAGLAAP